MNPLEPAQSLSDAARRMRRYRERRRYRLIEAIAGRDGIPEFLRRTPNGAAR